MRALIHTAAALAVLAPSQALACLEIVTPEVRSQAERAADRVVRVEALTEAYLAVPDTPNLKVGVATGRVLEVVKGRDKAGSVIAYRVVDGEGAAPSCPARRSTPPGKAYTLYLKAAGDWGPPTLLLPTD